MAEDLTVATRPGVLTVLVDPSDATGPRAIVRYIVTVTPLRGGASSVRVLIPSGSDRVLRAQFTLPRGRYAVSVTAVDARGRQIGWVSGTILVTD